MIKYTRVTKKPKFCRKHSRFVPNELKTVQQGGFQTITWREPCNFPGFQHGGNRIAGVQHRRMWRGQESPMSEINRKIRTEPFGMVGKPPCWTFTIKESTGNALTLQVCLVFVQNDIERDFIVARDECVLASGVADQLSFVFKHELITTRERAW